MKILKHGLVLLCSLSLVLCLAPVVSAAGYTYTVQLSAGGKGTFSGKDTIELTGISYDRKDRINLTEYLDKITLTDDRYYIKGFHLSGKEDLVASVPKTGDAVYVVSYGLQGQRVAYTVNYQDAGGTQRHPSQTFYGNVGDKPVVAFVYIEGYQPQAYNLTKTLSADESKNVFTFVYTPIAEAAPAETEEGAGAGAAAGGAAAGADAGAAGAGADAGAAGAGADAGAAGAGADAGAGAGAGAVAAPDEAVPQDLVDLDDEETPLGNKLLLNEEGERLLNLPLPVRVGMIAAILAAVGGCMYYILVMRKKKEKKQNG